MNAVSIDVDMMEQLPAKTLLRLVEAAQKAQKHTRAFQAAVNDCGPLFRRLEELDIEVDFSLRDGDMSLNFTGDGNRLRDVWMELRRNGWKPNSHPKKGDTSFYSGWEREGYASFWMSFTSSVCRRVQVGTKTVEQPIYETLCGELPELESDGVGVSVLPAPTSTEVVNDIPF